VMEFWCLGIQRGGPKTCDDRPEHCVDGELAACFLNGFRKLRSGTAAPSLYCYFAVVVLFARIAGVDLI
jgi:hypothetical protein